MTGRKYAASSFKYRYGFNGKENDNEVKGEGNLQDYGMRIYDTRIVRFLSEDPITDKYPELTPYQFASNRPIDGVDEDGLEWKQTYDKTGNLSGASWVGFKANGEAVDGTISSFNLSTFKGNYYYSSDKKAQTGSLSFFPKEVTANSPNSFGSVVHNATYEWNYKITFKNKPQEWTSILGFKHSDNVQNYDVNARIWKDPLNSSEEITVDKYSSLNENGKGYSSRQAIEATSSAFGLMQKSDAITAIYPEAIFLPLPKGIGLLGKGVKTATGGAKQWLRLGKSYSVEGGFKTYGLRWGASPRYASKIGNATLRTLNQDLRTWRIPFKSWKTADPGHLHFWKLN